MILRRLGNKKKIANEIQKYFPSHKIYIEPFFGAGGMFFNKSKAKYNIVNDLDSDVFNLFQVVMNEKEELEKAFYIMPIHSDLLDYWKKNEEKEPIRKALRFLFLSNLTVMGTGNSIQGGVYNDKISFYERIEPCFKYLDNVKMFNTDFKDFLNKKIAFGDSGFSCGVEETFIYCDPPYLGTDSNYSNDFTKEQSEDLFNTLIETKCKFAVSEFNHSFIIEQAEKRGLNVIKIGERQNLKNRRTEILVTNYENIQPTLFE
jgi:DNA adenine methylase